MTAIGCDISKAWIDVQVLEPDSRFRLSNSIKAIDRFISTFPAGTPVGMEATGSLHELLADRLAGAGHSVYVLNPRWVRQYARSVGARGKSDRGDAMVIARFVAAEAPRLHAYVSPSPEQRELRRLLLRRAEMVKLRMATRQSLGALGRTVVVQFSQLIGKIDRDIAALLATNDQWKALAHRLRSIPGIGPATTAHLVQVFTRIPFAAVKSFIAHTGMDPRPNDSGQKRGRRRLTHHGDGALRSMLFMAAMAACKTRHWRVLYEAQRAKGLPSTAAFIVVARKLATIAFSLFKSGQTYRAELMAS